MNKPLSVDITGDTGATAATIDLIASRRSEVPINGFEWVRGVRALRADFSAPDLFLVARPGPTMEIQIPEDLYLEFAQLTPEPDPILSFARRYGRLRVIGNHFHRDDNEPEDGEQFFDWQIEVNRLKAALDLWYGAASKNVAWVRRFLDPIGPNRKKGNPWLLDLPMVRNDDPLELAQAIVISTLNIRLTPATGFDHACFVPGCGFPGGQKWTDSTYAYVRKSRGHQPELVLASSNLVKALWLQFASAVAGQRKVKKCEAPDCGRYMDVSISPRPGACRMHPRCEERLKKKRYRDRKKKS